MAKADFYDVDKTYDYSKYWTGREYENAAESMAVRRILKGKHFHHIADIGGGYGRLTKELRHYADEVTLIEPSKKQRDIAAKFLKSTDIAIVDGTSTKTKLKDQSVDLITMFRVMHHLVEPAASFKEMHRVLADGGYVLLEVANSKHAKSRFRRLLKLQRTPAKPIDIKTRKAVSGDPEFPFVNHNPVTVRKDLKLAGFEVVRLLSVSNYRSPQLKKLVPQKMLLALEHGSQRTLAPLYFGPSLFFLLKKVPSKR